MRQGPNGRRSRNRHHGGGQHGQHNAGNSGGTGNQAMGNSNRPRTAASLRHQNFDSNCVDVRVRGNAWQVHEKYLALARDAQGSGDRISAENFLQHAEHYFRIIEAINEATAQEQRQRAPAPAFNQQPDIPSGYYDNSQGATVTMRNQSADVASAQTGAQDQAQRGTTTQQKVSQQQVFHTANIPPALTDPFFGSEESEDNVTSQGIAVQG